MRAQRDQPVGAGAGFDERLREPVGARVEFAVAHALAVVDQRDRIGPPLRMAFESLLQIGRGGVARVDWMRRKRRRRVQRGSGFESGHGRSGLRRRRQARPPDGDRVAMRQSGGNVATGDS
ncbi:hypothetical protein LEN_2078 [Lysobacter enzymogenes]|uniref:Uncharacterized protein n=1 Tax=Lysobacter enzymogenes TaxID=69 RepID=A0AAU9AQ38_LYSEN|nr:hypothetical protein LEN_2078 [Lysobacter enzymogenes]